MAFTFTDGDRYTGRAASGTDLSGKEGYAVKTDANGRVVLASAATDKIIGVLEDGGRGAGDNVSVVLVNGSGSFWGVCGAEVAKDAYITSDAAGKLIATTTAGNKVIGQAVQATSAANKQFEFIKKDFIHP